MSFNGLQRYYKRRKQSNSFVANTFKNVSLWAVFPIMVVISF